MLPGLLGTDAKQVGPSGAKLLASDTVVRRLRLRVHSSWPHVSATLRVNTGLRELELENCALSREDLASLTEAIAVNTSMHHLSLHANYLGEAAGRKLALMVTSNSTLRVLDLGYNNLGDIGGVDVAWGVKHNIGLQELNLRQNSLREASGRAFAAALRKHRTLVKLNLAHNKLGDASTADVLAVVSGNRTLRELNLAKTGIDERAGEALRGALQSNSTLQVLDVSQNYLREFAEPMLEALKVNHGLRVLRMADCSVRGSDLGRALRQQRVGVLQELDVGPSSDPEQVLAASLQPGSALRTLRLRNCVGRGQLSEFLRASTTLHALDLSYTRFPSSDGWQHALVGLAENTGLVTLTLGQCTLTHGDVETLVAALQVNHVLRELDLTGNQLRDDCGHVLAAGLTTEHASLRKLCLLQNNLGDATATAFADVLKNKATALRRLELDDDGSFSPRAKKALARTAARAHCQCRVDFR